MKEKVHPVLVAIALLLTLVLIIIYGHRTIREPPTAVGIGRDGKEMTQEQGEAMGRAMSGGAYRPSSDDKD